MKRLITSITFVTLTLLFILFAFPLVTFADTYGSGSYGGGVYNAQSASSTNVVSAVIAFFCTNQAPSTAPNLYEIDTTNTTAMIYFAPAGNPYDYHYISFGQGNNTEGYGGQINTSQSPGALSYKVNFLSPSTVYTFKVRGGNGCKPGPWSNSLTVQTLSSRSKSMKKFFPNNQVHYIKAPAPSWSTSAANYISSLLQGTPNTGFAPINNHAPGTSTKINSTSHVSHTSLWGSVVSFFLGIFHAL